MLTRLEINGFKNLLDFEVDFGPLTCIAGANGVGKSNIFDAVRFLSLLADLLQLASVPILDDILSSAWGEGTILYSATKGGDFLFGHDGGNDPAINSTARINPESMKKRLVETQPLDIITNRVSGASFNPIKRPWVALVLPP